MQLSNKFLKSISICGQNALTRSILTGGKILKVYIYLYIYLFVDQFSIFFSIKVFFSVQEKGKCGNRLILSHHNCKSLNFTGKFGVACHMMSTACQPKFLPVDGSSASDILHSQFYHTPATKGKGIYSLNRCVPVCLSFCMCLSVAKISVAFFQQPFIAVA